MLNVRTITCGTPSKYDKSKIQYFKKISEQLDPRTFRINLPIQPPSSSLKTIKSVNDLCEDLDIHWFNVPFNLMNNLSVEEITTQTLDSYPKSFINLIVTDNNMLDYGAMLKASEIIKKVSEYENGFYNFRLGVSCNPCANTPFFPFTYSSNTLGFSVGLELPDTIYSIIKNDCKNLDITEMQNKIISIIKPEINKLEKKCFLFQEKTNVIYHGMDLSIAPFPEEKHNVGDLMELLGLDMFGSNGTLFFTSFLTDTIKKLANGIKSVGFNGVMYSLMEDKGLCRCGSRNILSIDSLISYSSVCGCGLDMVPIPGRTYKEEIASIILDVSSLSTVLSKPLGIRLLPIRNKLEGEITEFDLDFICNTRIQGIKDMVAWNDSFKNSIFGYGEKMVMKGMEEFWKKKAESIAKEEGLKPTWYLYQDEEKSFLDLKLRLEDEKMLKYIMPYINKNAYFADLGAGNGYWTFKFAEKVKEMDAVDYQSSFVIQAIQRARALEINNISFTESTIQDFKSNKQFDVILISGVLIYLEDEEMDVLIENMKNYSKKGTILILREGTGIGKRHQINAKYSKNLKARYSAIYRTREELIETFKKIGFELLKDEDMFSKETKLNKYPETRLRLYKFRRK